MRREIQDEKEGKSLIKTMRLTRTVELPKSEIQDEMCLDLLIFLKAYSGTVGGREIQVENDFQGNSKLPLCP